MYTASKRFLRIGISIFLFFMLVSTHAATFNSVATGDWSTIATWDEGSSTPGASDVVNIENGDTITYTGSLSFSSIVITVKSGGVLNITTDLLGASGMEIWVNSGGIVNISNHIDYNSVNLRIENSGTINVTNDLIKNSTGILNNTNDLIIGRDASFIAGATNNNTNSGYLELNGTLLVDTGITLDNTGGLINYLTLVENGTILNGDAWTLPVELTNFSLTHDSNGSVIIDWTTASETNNDFFTIEKSNDGVNFVEMLLVNGAGTSSTPNKYSAIDNNPENCILYYRLKQTDFDGTETIYEVNTINNYSYEILIQQSGIEIFPGNTESTHNIIITSISGQNILSETITPVDHISIHFELKPGQYYLIVSGDKYYVSKLFRIE